MQSGGDSDVGERYSIAGLIIDVPGALVTRDGNPVALRSKCFDALVFFLRNPDRVVTKADLIEAVWRGISVSNDTVVGCIAEVREALRPGLNGCEAIQTVQRRGYRLPSDTFRRLSRSPSSSLLRSRWRRYVAVGGTCVLLATSAPAPVRNPPGIKDLVTEAGWWQFNEVGGDIILDSSGNGNSGRLIGGVRRIPGILGSAVEFDGVDGRIAGDTTGNAFPLGGTPRTIACWIRTKVLPAEDAGILHYGLVDKTKPATNFHLFIDREGRVGFGNGYNNSVVRSTRSVADGQWHHISADLNEVPERVCGLFIDGHLDSADRLAVAPMTARGTRWTMGIFMEGGVPFNGAIDDVRLFRASLGSRQRQALWTCSSPSVAIQGTGPGSGSMFLLPMAGSMAFLGYGNESTMPVLSAYSEGFAAVQLARSDANCGFQSYRGVEFLSGIRLAADLSFPNSKTEADGFAGPYFGAAPGTLKSEEPPETAGFWIAISPSGTVELRRLAPVAPVIAKLLAVPGRTEGASRALTYHFEVAVRGTRGTVRVNGVTADFSLPATAGTAAGFAFYQPSTPLFTRVPQIRHVQVSQGG